MRPVIQKDVCCVLFSGQERLDLVVVASERFERAFTRFGWSDEERATDSVVIVGAEVGMVPEEPVLGRCGKAIRKVASSWDRFL